MMLPLVTKKTSRYSISIILITLQSRYRCITLSLTLNHEMDLVFLRNPFPSLVEDSSQSGFVSSCPD